MSKNHEPQLKVTAWVAPDGGFRAQLGSNQFLEMGTSVAQRNPQVITYHSLPQGFFLRDIWTKFRIPNGELPSTEVRSERPATPEEQAALLDSVTERIETYTDFQTRLKTEPGKWNQAWLEHRINTPPTQVEFLGFIEDATALAKRLGNNLANQLADNPHLLNGQTETFQRNLSSLSRIVSANQEKKGG